jgi:hypothetical protein
MVCYVLKQFVSTDTGAYWFTAIQAKGRFK